MILFKKLFSKKQSTNPEITSANPTNVLPETPEERFAFMSSNERLGAIISLGDTGNLKYYGLLKYCILSDPDIDVKFAALKRINLFMEHPDTVPFLQSLEVSREKHSLEPYLSMALYRVGIITIEEFKRRVNGG